MKLDNEMTKKLAGLLPCSTEFTIEFTPALFDEVEEDYKPVFELRPLTKAETKEIASKATAKKQPSEQWYRDRIRRCVVGWTNLLDISSGKEIEFSSEDDKGADKKLFDLLNDRIINALMNEVLRISGLQL